jgi:hypothetical protein
VLAPLAERVDDEPEQIVDGDADADIVGITELTVILTVAVAEQPADVPVTVYVVLVEGVTVMLAVLSPVFHK